MKNNQYVDSPVKQRVPTLAETTKKKSKKAKKEPNAILNE